MQNYRVKLSGWIELFRPPNLFTLPGDVIAGAALSGFIFSSFGALIPVIIISLLLYCSGLLLNDYVDRAADAKERPARPIPSGRVSPRAVLAAAISMTAAALGISIIIFLHGRVIVAVVAVVLAACVAAYNTFARRIPVIGFIVMGSCRGLNVMLGAAAGPHPLGMPALGGASVEMFYIMSVTAFAYNETKFGRSSLVGKLIHALILLQMIMVVAAHRQYPTLPLFPIILSLGILYILAKQASKKFYGS